MLLKLSCFWFPIVRTSEGQLYLLIAVHSDKAYDTSGKKYFFVFEDYLEEISY